MQPTPRRLRPLTNPSEVTSRGPSPHDANDRPTASRTGNSTHRGVIHARTQGGTGDRSSSSRNLRAQCAFSSHCLVDAHLAPPFIPPLTNGFSPSCKHLSACAIIVSSRMWCDLSTLSPQPLLLSNLCTLCDADVNWCLEKL